MTHEKEQISEETDDSESDPWYYKLVARTNEACGKPPAAETAESMSSAFPKSQNNEEATWDNCLQLRIPTYQFSNAVFSMVWEIYGKYHDESMGDLNVHLAIWRMFMYTTLQALISFGKEYDENSFESKKIFISSQITDSSTTDLQYYTRTKNLEKLSGEEESKICELSEILGPRTPEMIGLKIMEYGDFTWRSTGLLSEEAERVITAKVYVFSDSILCQGDVNNPSTANEAWKKKNAWYGKSNFLKDSNGADGRKTEFVWRIFPRSTMLEILEEIQKYEKHTV